MFPATLIVSVLYNVPKYFEIEVNDSGDSVTTDLRNNALYKQLYVFWDGIHQIVFRILVGFYFMDQTLAVSVYFKLSRILVKLLNRSGIRSNILLRGLLHVRFHVRIIGVRFGVRFAANGILQLNFLFVFAELCRQTIVMGVR
jgi:hypothetical protein